MEMMGEAARAEHLEPEEEEDLDAIVEEESEIPPASDDDEADNGTLE